MHKVLQKSLVTHGGSIRFLPMELEYAEQKNKDRNPYDKFESFEYDTLLCNKHFERESLSRVDSSEAPEDTWQKI